MRCGEEPMGTGKMDFSKAKMDKTDKDSIS